MFFFVTHVCKYSYVKKLVKILDHELEFAQCVWFRIYNYIEGHGLELMEAPIHTLNLRPVEHFCDYLGRYAAALKPLSRLLNKLQ